MPHFSSPRRWALLLVLLLLGGRVAVAQTVALYTLTDTTGTYAPLTGGTVVSASDGGGTPDDGYSVPLALPFAFQFGSATFNTLTLTTNGYVGLGAGHTIAGNYNVLRNTAGAEDNVIAFANIDLEPAASGSRYRTEVTGTAPNRIFKIEADSFQRYSGVGGPGKIGSAQVWLFETSNDIELHYGAFSAQWGDDNFGGRFDSVRVGLRGVGLGDLAAATGLWAAPARTGSPRAGMQMSSPLGNLPTPGQVLRFALPTGLDLTPPALGPITLTPPAPGCAPQAHTVSLQPTDAAGIDTVTLTYAVGTGAPLTLPMTRAGNLWRATIPAQGTALVTWFVTATDASPQRNRASSPPATYADGAVTVDAGPDQTINVGSAVTLTATGNPRGAVRITEFTLNRFGTGATPAPPAYLGAADDVVELTNLSARAVNLSGYQFEVRSAGAGVARTYTLPNGTVLLPDSTAVLHIGTGTDSPADFYFNTGGSDDPLGSGADVGFVLLAPGGVPVDAVAVNNFAAATLPPGTWTGAGLSSPFGVAGAALTAPDTNSATGWTAATTAAPQSIGTANPGLPALPLPAVTWGGGVLSGASTQNPLTTPAHTTAGAYTYTVALDQNGCTATDNVTITVVAPTRPAADFTASTTAATTSLIVTFTDLSTNLPAAWAWSFAPNRVRYVGGTSATSRNPRVRFLAGGCYTVTLTVTNPAGTDTEVKTGYVCVRPTYCGTNLQGSPCSPTNAQLNTVSIAGTTLNNTNSGCSDLSGQAYSIFPATGNTTATLVPGQSYALTVQSTSTGSVGAWLDANANGVFEAAEFTLVTAQGPAPTPSTSTVMLAVPTTALAATVGLRIRSSVSANSIVAADACVTRFSGETEDYFVTLRPACALAAPTVTSNGPVCAGSLLTLAAGNQPAGTTYAWTGPDNFTSTLAAPSIAGATAAAAGVYSLVVSRGGCSSPAGTVTVMVKARPAPPASFATARCGPGSVRLTIGTVPPGTTYRWYATATGGTPLPGGNTSYNTPALTASTTYYVAAVVAGCESVARATATARIDPAVVATITAGGPTTFCTGGSVVLAAGGGAAGATYVWRRNTTVVAGAIGSTFTATQAGTYTVIITDPTTCAGTSAGLTVTTTPAASAAFAYAAGTFCRSATANPAPTISGTRGGTFSATPVGLTLNAATGQITLGSSVPGTYTVRYTVGTTCPDSRTQPVTISTAPVAAFQYGTGPLCAGSPDTLRPVLGAGASVGVVTATPAGLTLDAATGAIRLATSQPGTYTLTNTIVASGTCPAATATAAVTLVAVPAVPTVTANGPLTICAGGSVTLTASGGALYQWNDGSLGPTLTVSAAGSYFVTATNTAGCSSTSAPAVVTVAPLTTAGFAYPAPEYCLDSATPSVAPTVSGTAGGTFSATPAGLTLDAATGAVDLTTSAPGAYAVKYDVGGYCPSFTAQALTLTAPPVATFGYADEVCAGSGSPLAPTLGAGATLGSLTVVPATGLALDPITGVIDLAASTGGTYVVTNTVAGTGLCGSRSATDTVRLNPVPTLVISNLGATYCTADAPILLTGTVDGVAGVGIFTIDGAAATQLTPGLLGPGTYTIGFFGSTGAGCAAAVSQAVTVLATPPQPVITAAPQPSGVVVLTSSAATGNQWYLNGGAIGGATGPTYSVGDGTQSGVYTVVSTAGGCASAASVPVPVVVTGDGFNGPPLAALLQLYPNPTPDGHVVLALPPAAQPQPIAVLDGVGRVVWRSAAAAGATAVNLDLRGVPTGLYIVRVLTPVGPVMRRLVRE